MKSRLDKAGLTFFELVTIIILLGILVSIVIMKYIDFKNDAASAAADGSIATIREAIKIYYVSSAVNQPVDVGAVFPPLITTSLFADGLAPQFSAPYSYSYDSSTGRVTKSSS